MILDWIMFVKLHFHIHFFKVEEDIARPPNDKNSGSDTSGHKEEKPAEKLQLVHQIPK